MKQQKLDNLQIRVAVTPMLELSNKSFQRFERGTADDTYIKKYIDMSQTGNLLETPDGWFFFFE